MEPLNKQEIEAILNDLEITNYTITDKGTVDVDGTVDISFKELTEIPLQFGVVKGDFNCSNNRLESLKGAPILVGVTFFCHKNNLTSLKFSPNSVGKAFVCRENQLTTLEGCPRSINGTFDCTGNQLTTLLGGPEAVSGDFECSKNKLTSLHGLPEYIRSVLYCSGNPIPEEELMEYKKKSPFLIIGDGD